MDSSILVGIASIIVSAVAAYFAYKQSDLALKQYTLSYIEMENNDIELKNAREWLHDIRNDIDYITSFYSTKSFRKFKGKEKELKEGEFAGNEDELVNEYIIGRSLIQKVISSNLIASEAIIDGAFDEETYWRIRHRDFYKDEYKLRNFMTGLYQSNSCNEKYSRKAFRMVIKRWKLDPPVKKGIIYSIKKDEWEKYHEELGCNCDK